MKIVIPFVFAVALLALSAIGTTAEESESLGIGAGILPSSPFYAFDVVGEYFRIVFSMSDESKAVAHMEFSEERLAEADSLLSLNQTEGIDALMQDYQRSVAKSKQSADSSSNPQLKKTLATRLESHHATIETIQNGIGDPYSSLLSSTQSGVQKTIELLRS